MFNLTDILLQAQGGQATQNLARQFGLSTEQTQKVLEAFAPAFATGISRKAQDSKAAPNVFGMMAQANRSYAEAFENMAAATQPQTRDAGNEVLNQLFGSKDVSRAVASQVSAMTGVGDAVLKAMLPVVASMLMGGLAKSMGGNPLGNLIGAMFGGQQAQSSAGIGDILGAMMSAGQAQSGGALNDIVGALVKGSQQSSGAMAELVGALVASGQGAVKAAPQQLDAVVGHVMSQKIGTDGETVRDVMARTPNPAGPDTPIGDLLGAFASGFGRGRPEPVPEPEPEPVPEPTPADQLMNLLGQMFQAGREVQGGQQSAFEKIFDQFAGKKG